MWSFWPRAKTKTQIKFIYNTWKRNINCIKSWFLRLDVRYTTSTKVTKLCFQREFFSWEHKGNMREYHKNLWSRWWKWRKKVSLAVWNIGNTEDQNQNVSNKIKQSEKMSYLLTVWNFVTDTPTSNTAKRIEDKYPSSYQKAINCAESTHWLEAMAEQINSQVILGI